MLPTLKPDQHCLAWPYLFSLPKVNDLVVFKNHVHQMLLVKRISSIESNGQKLAYQVRGDNPSHSTDSRTFGQINKKQIIGKIIRFSG